MYRYLLILITVCFLKAGNKNTGSEYNYLLNENILLVYKTSFGETIAECKIENNKIVILNKSDKFTYRQTFINKTDGLYLYEVYQKVKPVFFYTNERTTRYDKPLLKLSYPLDPGKEWNSERTEYFDDDSSRVKIQCKVLAQEKITLDAGTFDTFRIETIMKSTDGSENIIEEWVSSDYGSVKTKVKMKGGGIMGTIRKLLGYGEIVFELKEIRKK